MQEQQQQKQKPAGEKRNGVLSGLSGSGISCSISQPGLNLHMRIFHGGCSKEHRVCESLIERAQTLNDPREAVNFLQHHSTDDICTWKSVSFSDGLFGTAVFAKSRLSPRDSDQVHNRRGCYDNSAACWSPLSKKAAGGKKL